MYHAINNLVFHKISDNVALLSQIIKLLLTEEKAFRKLKSM
jgi:hypothetical protein